ncbi:hypothetical protein, partial [Holospora undulata]|uniref:hypothetical protein n=1 Tax=Holospora undulata TaxID=1169117 RepID=UPI001267BE10
MEKDEEWKEEARLSSLISNLQMNNPKNLEQALCTFLSKHFNNEKLTSYIDLLNIYIDLLNMESGTLLKSPILKTMLIFPELAKKVFSENFGNILRSLINTPDALNCVFLSFKNNEKRLTEILNYLSDLGDSGVFDKVFEIFSKNHKNLFEKVAEQSNAKVLYNILSILEKDEEWKEESRLSNLINKLQLENPKNLEQALYTFLSKHFNNEKHTYIDLLNIYIDLLNMKSVTVLKNPTPILKTMLIFPALAKKVFFENFGNILKKVFDAPNSENRSKYEALQCVTANRLTGIEIDDQELCLYINNEKITLDRSNEAYSFVKGAIQLLPKEQKLSLLEQSISRISDPYIDFELEQYLDITGLSYDYILYALNNDK